MATQSYQLLKISWNLFDKHYTKLNADERSKVWDIYYDFY